MKRYVLGIAVLALGGCVSAGSSQSVATLGTAGDDLASSGSHTSSSVRVVAVSDSAGRDPIGGGHGERGIPTPEPAREPAIREAAPTPQPPFPAGRGDPARNAHNGW